MKAFIRDCHVGYICVHFTDTESRIRWGIDQRWKEAGEYTLARVSEAVITEHGASLHTSLMVQRRLADLVVQAAADPLLHKSLPCRTYALMLSYDIPCLLIEAEQSTERLLAIGAINGTPEEADAWIDALEASEGGAPIRTWTDGAGHYEVAVSIDPDEPMVSVETLALTLPRDVAESLAKQYADPAFREQLTLAVEQTKASGQILH